MKLGKLIFKTKIVKLKDLQPVDWNPRIMSDTDLKSLDRSIEEYGYVEGIIWNEKTKHIIGGHQRIKVLLKKYDPETEIKVNVVNLNATQEKALNLALNKIHGEWDDDLLSKVLLELQKTDKKILEYTGFTNTEIEQITSFFTKEDNEIALKYNGAMGQQENIRYPLIFYFNKESEKNTAENFFKTKTTDLDTKKLLLLIKHARKNKLLCW